MRKQHIVKVKEGNKTIYSSLFEYDLIENNLSAQQKTFVTVTKINGLFSIQDGGFKKEILTLLDKEEEVNKFIRKRIDFHNDINDKENEIVNSDNIIELTYPFIDIHSYYNGINHENISFDEIEDFQDKLPELIQKVNTKIDNLNDFFISPFLEEYKKKKPNAYLKHQKIDSILKIEKNSRYLFKLYSIIDELNGTLFDDKDLILHLNTYFVKDFINERKQDTYLYNGNKNKSVFYTTF